MENKQIVYIDESGDTGYTKKSTKYFILTAIIVEDVFTLRRIVKKIHKSKRDKKKANILHVHSETIKLKNKLIVSLNKIDLMCIVSVIDKNNCIISDPYLYVLQKMAIYLKSVGVKKVILAKKDTRKSYNKNIVEMFKVYEIDLIFYNMLSEKALQIADFYSWCVFAHIEQGSSYYYLQLERQITII
jgi:hypothetical protein